jgi:splicing factor U2AF 65 kDa subunit
VIEQLNGKEIGSKTLLVQKASVSSKQTQNNIIMSVDLNSSVAAILNLNVKADAAIGSLVATRGLSMLPTRILCLFNMFRDEDYDLNEDDYRELYEDIKSEIRKFGKVKALVIPRERKKGKQDKVICKPGKVFVCYDTVEQAQQAQTEFAGRRFQGRIILTSYFPEDLFENREYYIK